MLGYNNYTSPSVGCLVYLHNMGVYCLVFKHDVFTADRAKAMILRWAGVFVPGGQMQMPLIISRAVSLTR